MQLNVGNAIPLSKFFRFAVVSTSATPFDYTRGQQHWAIGYPDLVGPTFPYDAVVKGADGYPMWTVNTIPDAQALTPNIPPAQAPTGSHVLPEIPTPINKTAIIAAGLELCTDIMGNAALCPAQTPATTVFDWTEADHDALMAVRADITAIKAKLGA